MLLRRALLSLAAVLLTVSSNGTAECRGGDDQDAQQPAVAPEDMVFVPGGIFVMGSSSPRALPEERPVHRAQVKPFYMDVHEVTNDAFTTFIETTGYVTVAERPIDWELLAQQLGDASLAPGCEIQDAPQQVDVQRCYPIGPLAEA